MVTVLPAPVAPLAPLAPDAPLVPDVPDAPDAPLVPEAPDVPLAPEVPDAPLVPEAPDVPEAPLPPDEPLVPDAPLVPEAPLAPDAPLGPEAPLVPDAPLVPNVPLVGVTVSHGTAGLTAVVNDPDPPNVTVWLSVVGEGVDPAWYRNGSSVTGVTVRFALLPTVRTTEIATESGVFVLVTVITPKYVPVDRPAGFTPTRSGTAVDVPNAVLPLEVNGISQFRPL